MKVAYLTMNGNVGCLPDNSQVFTSRKAAIEYLIDLFNLPRRGAFARNLRQDGIVYFGMASAIYGAQYAEIVKLEGDEAREALAHSDDF